MQWHQTKPWLFRANREPARRKKYKRISKRVSHTHWRDTHTKTKQKHKTAHLSLSSLPFSRIKARLTLMRESRVHGGKKRHEGGGGNYGERSTQGRRPRGLRVPQNTCADWRDEGASFFSAGKKKASSSDRAEQGAVASSSKFSRSFRFFFTHRWELSVANTRPELRPSHPRLLGGWTSCVASNESVLSRPSRQRIGHAEQ